jgi:hypothetical protein
MTFFPIFEIANNWSPSKYIHLRGGESISYELSTFPGDVENDEPPIRYDPSAQLIVDFDVVKCDIEQFRNDDKRIASFSSSTIRGALYIDSKNLRNLLAPIPMRSLRSLGDALQNLAREKMEGIRKMLLFCRKKLKKEPGSLERYVDLCEFIERVEALCPHIEVEIDFLDQLYYLLDGFDLMQVGSRLPRMRDPLMEDLKSVRHDLQTGKVIKSSLTDKYSAMLNNRMKRSDHKLRKYLTSSRAYVGALNEAKMGLLLPEIGIIRDKLNGIETEIKVLRHCREVMKVEFPGLVTFEKVKT